MKATPPNPPAPLAALVDRTGGAHPAHEIRGAAAMHRLGMGLAAELHAGDVLLLHGDLGAGKTTLTQGIAAGLRVPEAIRSPTFGLVAEYDGLTEGGTPVRLYHLDLYRLDTPAELEGVGFDRYAEPDDGISVIEWPERAGGWLPERYLLVAIDYAGPDVRRVTIQVVGATHQPARATKR